MAFRRDVRSEGGLLLENLERPAKRLRHGSPLDINMVEASSDMGRAHGQPLQLVTLNMKERSVEVNEDALSLLETAFKRIGTQKVAVVSVMGAFRGGKSFLLDLFLRFLRYEQATGVRSVDNPPERKEGVACPLPAWITSAGSIVEGHSEKRAGSAGGFRFKGGMDHCTEGIWVWSEPFVRKLPNGDTVAVLLMDTQGAWDSTLTKEQSATIFGLTAVLSSKQVYNVSTQIQEDKVENLAYFMRFAQEALRKAAAQSSSHVTRAETERPFQSLDFLVRDWGCFQDEWSVAECLAQMDEHLSRHLNPEKVAQNTTAQAVQQMFQRIRCFTLPHPGLKIQRAAWTGNVNDIDQDFVRFLDIYVKQVFAEGLDTKKILGQEMSTLTFPLVLREFVEAFRDAAPAAKTFTEAMETATILIAKEQAMQSYTKKMSEAVAINKGGVDPEELKKKHLEFLAEIQKEFTNYTILGSDNSRSTTWNDIHEHLQTLWKTYTEENERRLERALAAFANISLLGFVLFVLDRLSDWTCDWWSKTCVDMSKLLLSVYACIFLYVGWHCYFVFHDRGQVGTAIAVGELWKEMMRLVGVYADLINALEWNEIPKLVTTICSGKFDTAAQFTDDLKSDKDKKSN